MNDTNLYPTERATFDAEYESYWLNSAPTVFTTFGVYGVLCLLFATVLRRRPVRRMGDAGVNDLSAPLSRQ